jgi:hypothetical protein
VHIRTDGNTFKQTVDLVIEAIRTASASLDASTSEAGAR